MAGDSESWEVWTKWCGQVFPGGKTEARTRSGSVRPLKTTLSGVAVLGLLCLIASIGDARRWPVGGPTELWQTHQLRARWLLQAGTSTSSSSQASTTPILYGQVLKQTDRSSGSLAVDGGAVVVARVIQPPPPPPPRSLVPTTIRGTLSPQAVFVGIAFGTFVACCIGVFLAWRTIETTDWSQVRAWLSKWLGRPLAQQQATMVSTLNGERTDGPQAEAGATEAATADATTHSPTTGGYVSGTGSQSQLAQAGASSAGDGNTPAGPATLAPLPLAGVHVAGSHPGRETEDSHARSQLAAGPHSQRPLAQNEGVSNGGAPAEDAAGLGGHPAGCGSDGLRLAAARLPGQLATNSDASLGAGETAGVQGLTPAGAGVGCSPGGNA